MKFTDSKTPKGFVVDAGAEVGTYSEDFLLRTLDELYEIKKVIDRDIRIAEQKLKIKLRETNERTMDTRKPTK